MKRTAYRAVVTSPDGESVIGERVTYAWNSAIRASEAIVREFGRGQRYMLTASTAERLGECVHGKYCHCADMYRRTWTTPAGLEYIATVTQVQS